MAGLIYVSLNSRTRIAYIDLPEVFAGFELKKDLESKLQSEVNQKNKLLDSMKLAIGHMPTETEGDLQKIAYGKQNILQAEEAFRRDNEVKVKQFDDQIFSRLNTYMKEFADEEGYDFILGAEGSGLIMAASDKVEVTEKVIEFINKKYQGE